jgi:hypothetical protein
MNIPNCNPHSDPLKAYAHVLACKNRIGRNQPRGGRNAVRNDQVSSYLTAFGEWVATMTDKSKV